ncbi:MAG: hypothetical protein ACI4V1_07525, partial [Eubacteriales bacterium]
MKREFDGSLGDSRGGLSRKSPSPHPSSKTFKKKKERGAVQIKQKICTSVVPSSFLKFFEGGAGESFFSK